MKIQERLNALAHPASGHRQDATYALMCGGWFGVLFHDSIWEAMAYVPVLYILNRLLRRWGF